MCYKGSSDERSECLGTLFSTFFLAFFSLFFSPGLLRSTFLMTSGVEVSRFKVRKGWGTFSHRFSPVFMAFQAPTRIFYIFARETPGVRIDLQKNAENAAKTGLIASYRLLLGPADLQTSLGPWGPMGRHFHHCSPRASVTGVEASTKMPRRCEKT